MTDTSTDLTHRLRLAADYLNQYGWIQGAMGVEGRSACLTGAIRFCAPKSGDEHLIRGVLQKRDRAERWNDRDVTNADDVIGYLRTAEITDADLADTYGPQWMEIVALVRTTASLPESKSLTLLPAAYAAAAAAASAYADAAADAAYAAAAYADAANAAYYAYYAIRGAARGLAVRHLVGTNGFTQDHYDTLTGPWRNAVGRLHENDANLMVGA